MKYTGLTRLLYDYLDLAAFYCFRRCIAGKEIRQTVIGSFKLSRREDTVADYAL